MAEIANKKLFPYGVYQNYLLAKTGHLFSALEYSGVDPKSLCVNDFAMLTRVFRQLLQSIDSDVSITQYYCHYKGAKVSLAPRSDKRSELLSRKREEFLNQQRCLSSSHVFWLMDKPPEQNLNKIFSLWFVSQLLQSPFSRRARAFIKEKLSARSVSLVLGEELKRQADELDGVLDEVLPKLKVFGEAEKKGIDEIWRLCRSLVNFNFDYLLSTERAPKEHWNCFLSDGQVHVAVVDGMDCLKLGGARPLYARIASVVGYGEEYVPEGIWGRGDTPPTMEGYNYIICNKFTPFSRFEKSNFIKQKQDELYRQTLSIQDLMQSKGSESNFQEHLTQNDYFKEMSSDLNHIKHEDDRYGLFHSHVVVFDEDPQVLKAASRQMNLALTESGLRVVWENAGLLDAYFSMMPAYAKRSLRAIEMNSTKVAASSLIFKSSEGQRFWMKNKTREEALYIFESTDGSPFYFVPYIGGKCLILGVGPTRSGKTFFKIVIALHYLKFGGIYNAIDVDPGTEPLARFYKENGSIFRQGEDASGFNPFSVAEGPKDNDFITHLLKQINCMLQFNDNEDMKKLEMHEQQELDKAIVATLNMPTDKQSLIRMVDHCSESIRNKLSRWLRGGIYGDVFDNDKDAVGTLNRMVSVYNLASVKDDKALSSIICNEIFYRIVRLFEKSDNRLIPKFLDIDECQYLLSIPGMSEMVEKKARTWFKHQGGLGLWTQSPKHYENIPGWNTLRSSASTLVFMADPQMDREEYKRVFNLTDGDVEIISKLKPGKQAFIKQPDILTSKVVNLNATPEEYAIATSKPHESEIVQRALKKYPDVDQALASAIEEMELENA